MRWVSPNHVVEVREYSYMIEHLITNDIIEVHGSRLKFYHNARLDVKKRSCSTLASKGL